MRFVNPNFRSVKKQFNNEEKVETLNEEKKDNIIYLDEILNTTSNKKIEIEYIDYPHNAIITNVPRSINLMTNQIGIMNIKYSNKIDDNMKQAM